jgi:hypothetical protein
VVLGLVSDLRDRSLDAAHGILFVVDGGVNGPALRRGLSDAHVAVRFHAAGGGRSSVRRRAVRLGVSAGWSSVMPADRDQVMD